MGGTVFSVKFFRMGKTYHLSNVKLTFSEENLGWRAPVARLNLAVCTAIYPTIYPDIMILYKN